LPSIPRQKGQGYIFLKKKGTNLLGKSSSRLFDREHRTYKQTRIGRYSRQAKTFLYFKLLTPFGTGLPKEYSKFSLSVYINKYSVAIQQYIETITGKIQYKQLCTTGIGQQLVSNTRIRNEILRIIIDSGATGNFIKPATANTYRIKIQKKQKPYCLNLVDRENIEYNKEVVDRETVSVVITITRGYQEDIQFDIVEIGDYKIILGIL
jgi:hypothetical protein